MSDPYHRTTFQGKRVDERTKSALEWVNRHFHKRTGKYITVVQGSYNAGPGAVSASAGTHDGGGVVDFSVIGLTIREQHILHNLTRKAGFASWIRPYIPRLWPRHIHAVLLGHRNASHGAKQQMASYLRHRNGLVGDAWDGSWRPKHNRVWSHRRKKPIVHR